MANNTEKPKVEEYILKPGFEHNGFKDGVRHLYVGGQAGNDRVLLTEAQAHSFRDKFESLKDMNERVKAQQEVNRLQAQQDKIRAALEEKGITLEELLDSATIKKPDPQPSVGTPEPAPKNVTPPPIGSTPDPVNKPPGDKK